MKEKLTPLGKRIIVVLIAEPTLSKSGLYIPVQNTDIPKPYRAKVVAVGKDCECLKKGMTILLANQYAGADIDDDMRLVREEDVLAIIG